MKKRFGLIIILLIFNANFALAEDVNSRADFAVANILFDYDRSSEFATYAIDESGFVSISFSRDIPELLYGEILTRMQNSPEITGVLSDRGGPVCGFFN
ncbi:MAG: hypothetical protein ACC707_10560 [Thiohalomonadales bacterium]